MAIVVSEETKKRVRNIPLQENLVNFTPVSLVDMEVIAPSETNTATLPTSVWFAHNEVLYEFLTPSAYNIQSYKKVMGLASKHASFKLFIRTEDNVKFLRFVEECRNKKTKPQEVLEKEFENSLQEVKRRAQIVLTSIADMKMTPAAVEASTQVVQDVVNTVMNQKKIVSLLMRMLAMDGNYLNHAIAVSVVGTALAKQIGLQGQAISTVSLAGLFHDLGHFKLPTRLLGPDKELSGDELEIYKSHTVYGHEMLDDLTHQGLKVPREVEIVALQHHEKFNGYGYPNRKRGRQEEEGPSGIHIYARIIAIADSYCEYVEKAKKDAKISHVEILARMLKSDGSFDPILLGKFKEIIQEV